MDLSAGYHRASKQRRNGCRGPSGQLSTSKCSEWTCCVSIGLLLSVAAASAFNALVVPYTDRAQIDEIARAVESRELLNIHGSEAAGPVLQGLYAAGLSTTSPNFSTLSGSQTPFS